MMLILCIVLLFFAVAYGAAGYAGAMPPASAAPGPAAPATGYPDYGQAAAAAASTASLQPHAGKQQRTEVSTSPDYSAYNSYSGFCLRFFIWSVQSRVQNIRRLFVLDTSCTLKKTLRFYQIFILLRLSTSYTTSHLYIPKNYFCFSYSADNYHVAGSRRQIEAVTNRQWFPDN